MYCSLIVTQEDGNEIETKGVLYKTDEDPFQM